MLGVNLYGQTPYGGLVVTRKIVVIADSGNGNESFVITAFLVLDESGSGIDVIGGEYSKIITDAGVGQSVIQIIVPVNLIDSGTFTELLGGRRWVIQKLDNQTWTVKPATGTWTEKTKTSQVWTEKDEIE